MFPEDLDTARVQEYCQHGPPPTKSEIDKKMLHIAISKIVVQSASREDSEMSIEILYYESQVKNIVEENLEQVKELLDGDITHFGGKIDSTSVSLLKEKAESKLNGYFSYFNYGVHDPRRKLIDAWDCDDNLDQTHEVS